jgi:hypothetical protein
MVVAAVPLGSRHPPHSCPPLAHTCPACVSRTAGEDLHKVLWLKSRNSEVWLERRTHYTRSTAVMSMVGYILGLGDRHPSNLMLDRYSGEGMGGGGVGGPTAHLVAVGCGWAPCGVRVRGTAHPFLASCLLAARLLPHCASICLCIAATACASSLPAGKLLHIDFGDCFEASMNRDKFPEKVPFRLTRMMVKAMEVSGIEGNFRCVCVCVGGPRL